MVENRKKLRSAFRKNIEKPAPSVGYIQEQEGKKGKPEERRSEFREAYLKSRPNTKTVQRRTSKSK